MGTVNVEVVDLVATVTFDRPPVNAIDFASMAELTEVFASFTERRDVRAVIFTATGDRAFIAGVDLAQVGDRDGAAEPPAKTVVDPGHIARDLMWAIADCAVPVIAAVNGPALGAGLAFAACCDILLASENATFGTTEINVGLLGASAHLSLLVGRHKAREMFFTGEQVPASELYRVGAVRAVVPRAELLATATELARSLAAKSPIAMRLAKEAMNRVEFLPLRDAYRIEQDYTNRMLRYEDAAEARAAFLDKRPPEWHWK
jgi:enoyl-CoA hydratase